MILHNPQISGSLTFDGNGSIALPSSTTYTPGVVSGSDQIASTFAQTILDDTSAGAVRTTIGVADTQNISEHSSNLYYTDTRVKTKLNTETVVSGSTQIITLVGVDEDNMSSNSATKLPTQQSVKAYVDAQIATKDALSELSGDTDDVSEGSSNLYYTDARVKTKLTAENVSSGSAAQIKSFLSITSSDISDVDAFSQSGNYSGLRAQATTAGDVGLGNVTNESKSTMFTSPTFTGNPVAPTQTGTDDSTKIATTAFVQDRVDTIIGNAGSTLDTLGELSASLSNDQDALTSLTTTVGTKLAKASNLSDLADAGTARTNLGVANTQNISEHSSNLYYTDARVKTKINAEGVISQSAQVVLNDADKTGFNTADVSEDSSNLYYTDARVKTKLTAEDVVSGSAQILNLVSVDEDNMSSNSATKLPTQQSVKSYVDTQLATKDALSELSGDTDDVSEGSSNLYYTDARVKTKLTAEDVVSGSAQIISLVGVDEDNFASNSATKFPSQQSVKAYVDAQIDTKDALSELSGDTDDVSEGSSNLYYTDARVKTKINAEGVISSSAQVQSLGGVNNNTITFTAGAGLDGGGAITLNQSSDETVTFTVADGVVSGSSQINAQSATNPAAIYDNSGTPTLRSGITQAELQTAIGVDASGTDNSTDVTLAGSYDYLTLSGQEITLGQIDYSTDVSNKPTIANATITLTAGTNLSGGGNFTTNQVGDETITINLDLDGSTVLSGSLAAQLPSGTVSGSDQVASTFAQTILDDANAGAVRTTIGVDAAGTDNSTDVTLAGNDYLTISGQQITANTIQNDDLANSSISIDGSAISLGGSVTTLQLGTSGTTALAGNTTTISGAQASAITTNSAKVGYTDALVKAKLTAENVLSGSTHAGNQIFSNNVTVQGNLDVDGTTTFTSTNNIQIGDNIIELNHGGSATTGGLLVKDASGGSQLSGSLLWDSVNDYWKAGRFNNEQQIITKENNTDDLSEGSTNLYYTNTRFNAGFDSKTADDLTEGSTNLYYTDNRVKAKLNTEGVVSGSVTAQLPSGIVSGSEQISYTSIANRPNIYRTIAVSGQDNIVSDGESDTLNFAEGGATTITTNASNDTITISSVNTEYSVGDGGLTQNNFTNTLKSKLDNIEATADVTDTGNVHPILDDKLVVSGSASDVRTFLNVENGADVTDATNVTAAGALMDSEVDADLKTLSLPANTTISAFGKTLVDDADAAAARSTLGVDAAGADNSTDVTLANTNYLSLSGQEITGGTVPIGSGGTGATTAGAARTALGVDAAGTDNSTDVTLVGSYDYISISGQAITVGQVDYNTDISNKPTTISGAQASAITANTNKVGYTDARVKTKLNAEGVFSSSAQVEGDFLEINGDGVFSGSAQVDYNSIQNRPTTITNTQASNITTNNNKVGYTDALVEAKIHAEGLFSSSGQFASSFAQTILDDANAGAVRTTIGVDASGTDNSTDVTLNTTSYDYLSISGQQITLGQINATTDISNLSTNNVSENTNLYFTNARADARIANAILDEDNMASNSATQIPSQQSVKAYVDSQVAGKDALSELSGDTDDVSEGSSNLYYTDARVSTRTDTILNHSNHTNITVSKSGNELRFSAASSYGNSDVTSHINDLGVVSGSSQINGQSVASPAAIYDNSGTPTLRSGITAAEVRTAIGVDAAGTVNYTLPTNLAGDDIDIDTTALTGATVISDLDLNITTNTSGLVTDANGSVSTRTLTLSDLGFTGATNANNYSHPTFDGDDIDIDTGALTGATVISDLDLNITTNSEGHVTDANGAVSTRTLTLANLGYTGATDANNYVLPTNLAGDDIDIDTGALTGATVISDLDINITTNTSGLVTDANASVATRTLTATNLGLGNVTNESKSTMFSSTTFTGNPIAPTQDAANSSTRIATTAFVQGRIDDIIGNAGSTLDTLGELSASLASDQSGLASLTTTVGGKLQKDQNLSDLTNAATARTNLGVDAAGTVNYVLPTNLAGDDIDIDTTLLSGATVISDLDINITTDTSGRVTDANGSVATRNLTKGDLGLGNVENTALSTYTGNGGALDNQYIANGANYISSFDITSQTDSKYLRSDANDTATGIISITNSTASTSKTTGALKVTGGVGISGALNVGGDVVAFASSDERLKDNIELISNPIEKVQSLKGVTWNWNENADELQQTLPNVGVIAQDVEKVLPELVTNRDNGYKGVDYAKLTGLLIEAIKEQQKEIDSLKEKLK
jgi:hypothetical protein